MYGTGNPSLRRAQLSDIDKKSLEYARKNIQLNNLESQVKLVLVNPKDPLLPLDRLQINT